MKQLTIRGFDDRLESCIRQLARREGISLNRAVLRLIRRGANLDDAEPDVVGTTLDHLMGTWTEKEGDAVDRALVDFSHIDEEMWTWGPCSIPMPTPPTPTNCPVLALPRVAAPPPLR